uniref:Transcriptional cofactor Bfc domain-containing protein n=1 Tax=Glossina austeni TaxID=7395 RepID=A0A1A9VB70_GLOAU
KPKSLKAIDNNCDDDSLRRRKLSSTSELTNRLLPPFNLKGSEIGNTVLITRSVANGPAIAGCGAKPLNCNPKQSSKSCSDSAINVMKQMARKYRRHICKLSGERFRKINGIQTLSMGIFAFKLFSTIKPAPIVLSFTSVGHRPGEDKLLVALTQYSLEGA